jgi:hypothetical protein
MSDNVRCVLSLCGWGGERECRELLLDPSEHFRIGLRLDLARRRAGTLGALLVRAIGAFRLVQGEDVLALVAGVVGVLLAEDVVGVAVGKLVALRSV